MATAKTSAKNLLIIPANAPRPDEGYFIVIYGKGGVGKTSTACLATDALMLDCTGGARDKKIDYVRIHTATELEAALGWLQENPASYKTVILDSPDALYERTLTPQRDSRKSHKDAQGVTLPLFATFWGLPMNRILVVNEKKLTRTEKVDGDDGREEVQIVDIQVNFPNKVAQLLDDRADVLMRAENSGKTGSDGKRLPTRARTVRITDSMVNIQAKTRFDILSNGMELTAALRALGIIVDATTAEQPSQQQAA